MPAHGPTTILGIPIGLGRARDATGWFQQLHARWAARKTAHHAAHLAALSTRWDATREAVLPVRADAALDMIAATHASSTTTALCDLSV